MKTAKQMVSVIMPVYNGREGLRAALESVRAQDYPRLELVVVDDGSTDGSAEVLESFARSWSACVRVLSHPRKQRRGIGASYQLGLKEARGAYVAFLEHDDMWATNKISEAVKVFEEFPEVGVVFSDVYLCNEKGRVAADPFKTWINRSPTDRPLKAFWRLLWGNCVSTFSNVVVRRKEIHASDIATTPEGFQDWMLLLLLSCRCKFYHCSRTKIFWRQRPDSYHAKLRRLPKYRRKRRMALKTAIEKILQEGRSSCGGLYMLGLAQRYWCAVISLFSAGERIADFLNRRISMGKPEQQYTETVEGMITKKRSQDLSPPLGLRD